MANRTPNDAYLRDPLTGFASLEHARDELAAWLESGNAVHAMLISAGRIERVNVAFGEHTGDGALIEVAQRIRSLVADELQGQPVQLARSSGTGFLVAVRDDMPSERFAWIADQLADRIAAPIADPVSSYAVRLNPRIALIEAHDGDTPDRLLDDLSETSRHLGETAGKRVAWASGAQAFAERSNYQLEEDLLGALDRDEIEVFFQPQYRVADDRLVGAEALARWHHPVLGRIGAATLFAIAARAEQVVHLSQHIARKALLAAGDWPRGLRLSLNITPEDLAPGNFAPNFLKMLSGTKVRPDCLTLEITEQVLLADLDRVGDTLASLRERGVSLSLDDFGAGFCNFRYLKTLPIDTLKLDRTMLSDVLEDERDLAVLRAIVAMGHALELAVLVEGVESAAQRALIAREGCDYYQGFFKAEPMTGAAFLSLAMSA